jgi:hypothetical protein
MNERDKEAGEKNTESREVWRHISDVKDATKMVGSDFDEERSIMDEQMQKEDKDERDAQANS